MAARLSPRNSEVNALEQRGYLIGKKIGQGSYATVHLADYVDVSSPRKMRLACKIFDKEKAPRDFLEKFFPRELEILTKIENPHIIQVHSILQRGPRVFIFMRFADNGDLLDFVKRNGVVPENQSKLWFKQMATGLQYLHLKNIAHRDLKCENILLSRRFNVKLADFGFARYCQDLEGRRVLSMTYCGSAAYAAPEVVSGTPYNPKLADVWSLGIILFIMLNASMPFDDSNLRKLLKDQVSRNWVFRSRVKDTVTPVAKQIVRQILEPDMTQRLTLDRVMSHEWVKNKIKTPSGRLVQSAPQNNSTTSQTSSAASAMRGGGGGGGGGAMQASVGGGSVRVRDVPTNASGNTASSRTRDAPANSGNTASSRTRDAAGSTGNPASSSRASAQPSKLSGHSKDEAKKL